MSLSPRFATVTSEQNYDMQVHSSVQLDMHIRKIEYLAYDN